MGPTIAFNYVDLLGYAGGIVLAVALFPQVYRSWKTRSTRDISYEWQLLYLLGLTLYFAYLVMIKATAAWLTIILELAMVFFLLALKCQIDGCSRKYDDKGLILPLTSTGDAQTQTDESDFEVCGEDLLP
jgi:MtN3 and saliva related transmembrane protein